MSRLIRVACLLVVVVLALSGRHALSQDSPPTCPFCLTALGADDFCPRCGRLARLTGTSAEHRFWGDAVYAEYARFGDIPKLEGTFTTEGLVSEVAAFESGDRIELTKTKKGAFAIEGKVGGSNVHKEDSFKGEMTEKLDDEHRIVQRTVQAKRNGDPDSYLYRVVDYKYAPDGRLAKIEFSSKVYLSASDWEKKPAAWFKRTGGEVVMVRVDGVLSAIETTVRTFKRSLRGEPEPGDERTMRQTVVRSGSLVDGVAPPAAAAK